MKTTKEQVADQFASCVKGSREYGEVLRGAYLTFLPLCYEESYDIQAPRRIAERALQLATAAADVFCKVGTTNSRR